MDISYSTKDGVVNMTKQGLLCEMVPDLMNKEDYDQIYKVPELLVEEVTTLIVANHSTQEGKAREEAVKRKYNIKDEIVQVYLQTYIDLDVHCEAVHRYWVLNG